MRHQKFNLNVSTPKLSKSFNQKLRKNKPEVNNSHKQWHDLITQIDKIKKKLNQMKLQQKQSSVSKCKNKQLKQQYYSNNVSRNKIKNKSQLKPRKNLEIQYQTIDNLNNCNKSGIEVNNRKNCPADWNVIKHELKRLEIINSSLMQENQYLESKLLFQENQKKNLKNQLERITKSQLSNKKNSNIPQISLYQHKKNQAKRQNDISRSQLYLTRIDKKSLQIKDKQNRPTKKQNSSIQDSKLTEKIYKDYINYYNIPEDNLIVQSGKTVEKSKKQLIKIKQKNGKNNDQLLLDESFDRFSISNNVQQNQSFTKFLPSHKISPSEYQNNKLKLLEQAFQQLISLGKLQQNKHKKKEMRKELAEIAHQISILKGKSVI